MVYVGDKLSAKLRNAVVSSEKATEALMALEDTLCANNLPLNEWKEEEAKFLKAILQPDARKRVTKSPYEPVADNGIPSLL